MLARPVTTARTVQSDFAHRPDAGAVVALSHGTRAPAACWYARRLLLSTSTSKAILTAASDFLGTSHRPVPGSLAPPAHEASERGGLSPISLQPILTWGAAAQLLQGAVDDRRAPPRQF